MKIKPLKIKPIKIHFGLDSDRDKVPDFKDCRPFNPKKQHLRPSKTTRKRLEQLPIYVTNKPMGSEEDVDEMVFWTYKSELPRKFGAHHILSKEAKYKSKSARQQLLGAIKKHPSIIGDVERTKPKFVVYTSEQPEEQGENEGWQGEDKVIVLHPKDVTEVTKKRAYEIAKEKYPDYEEEVRYDIRTMRTFPQEESRKVLRKKRQRAITSTMHHELTHVRQRRNIERAELEKQRQLPYEERPYEIQARETSCRELKKYRKRKPSGKAITETLELD